jgi:adenylate kinase family enzyme
MLPCRRRGSWSLGTRDQGKSTLARAIAAEFRLPVFSLDGIVWTPGWRKRSPSEKNAAIEALIRKPAWVIDGVSETVEQTAEVVVFLDVPPPLCIWRCGKRNLRYLFRSRPDLPDDCPEWRIVLHLLRLIRRFDRDVRPAILSRKFSSSRYIHVRGGCDNDSVLALLRRSQVG